MISVQVVGLQRTTRNLDRAKVEARQALRKALRGVSFKVRNALLEHLTGAKTTDPFWGVRSPSSGPFLGARSGQTRARISPGGVVFEQGTTLLAPVGSPDAHVKLYEEGGTVTGSPFLRIPTAAAQTAAGVDRYAGRSARDIPGAFLWPPRHLRGMAGATGGLWVVRNKGAGGLERLYLLVHSVTHRGRHIFATVAQELAPVAAADAGAELKVVVARANS